MKTRFDLNIVIAAVLFLTGVATLHAQTAVTGSIDGEVSDQSGASIAAAVVDAVDTKTGVQEETRTNSAGLYRFSSLIPGLYTIKIEKQGFNAFVQDGIQVDAGTGQRIDARLPVGSVVAKVEVTAAPPSLQTDSPEISDTIQQTEISTLPTFGRNITRLALLAPGAFMKTGQLDLHPENAGEDFDVNINGAQTNNNSHLLDGVDNTEAIQGYSLLVAAQDSVQEVKLTTSNYDAEYGRVSGGVWQITTKSGTNDLHGSAFEYYRTAGFFAADSFSQPNGVPGNVWNQFGGSLGGPVKKDKLFFFGDYQGVRNNLFTSSLYTAPIDRFKAGDFSSVAATNPIYDPTTGNPDGSGRTQFSCNSVLNVICPDRISHAATNLLALLPEPSDQSLANNNYTVSRPALFDQDQFDTRGDYFVNAKNLVFGKFSYFRAKFFTDNVFGPDGGGPPLGGIANSGNSADHVKSAMADYQHTFSPTLLQDFRFAFSRIVITELQLDSNLDAATAAGIPNINLGTVYTSGLPTLTVDGPTGAFTMGDEGLPFFEREANFEFFDNWTKVAGRHTFKVGADVEKFFGIRTDVSGRGSFDFDNNLTGNSAVPNSGLGMASFLLGLSDSFSRDITLVQPQEKQWKLAFYGQDTWQVNRQLTLHLGVRWDDLSPIFTQQGQSVGNIDLSTDQIWLTNLAGKYAGVTTSKTEFSPRVGAAYRFPHDIVLRGGYGRSYFMNPYGAGFGTQGCCWPIKQSQSDTQSNPYAPLAFTLDQGPGVPAALPSFPANGKLPFDGGPDGYSEYFVGIGKYPHSFNDSYNVTLEHAFPGQITASIAFVGNIGRNLWDNIDVNAPVPGAGDFNPRRPYYSTFGWTQEEYQRNDEVPGYQKLQSNFNSLQLRVEKRFSSGLYLLSNYTWDKSLDEGTFGPTNQFNFRSNYGNSDSTRPWASVSAFNWDIPLGSGRQFANGLNRAGDAVIGGWTLSGVVNAQGGTFFTPNLANNASLNSTIGLRPNRNGSGKVSNPNRYKWFNPADFSVPAPYTYGDSGRNILLAPGFGGVDLSLLKSFKITEGTRLELKWDAFNAFNRENLGSPNSSVDTATAGQITGIVDFRRRMQIGAHITF
jgi:outer membrane receptor protein involved in Fe transport